MVKAAAEMPKNVLMNSETLLREAFSGIAQIDTEEKRPFPDSDTGMFWWPLKSHTAFVFSEKFDEQLFIRESLLRKGSIENLEFWITFILCFMLLILHLTNIGSYLL